MTEPPLPPDSPEAPNEEFAGDSPSITDQITDPPRPHWLKRLLACNPFYLVSAALLLYGC